MTLVGLPLDFHRSSWYLPHTLSYPGIKTSIDTAVQGHWKVCSSDLRFCPKPSTYFCVLIEYSCLTVESLYIHVELRNIIFHHCIQFIDKLYIYIYQFIYTDRLYLYIYNYIYMYIIYIYRYTHISMCISIHIAPSLLFPSVKISTWAMAAMGSPPVEEWMVICD